MEGRRQVPKKEELSEEDAHYKAVLDQVYTYLWDIPVNAPPEYILKASEYHRDAIDTLEKLITHPQFSETALWHLGILAQYCPESNQSNDLNDIDLETGARAREILFANKPLLLDAALESKRHPNAQTLIQLESIPGYGEEITTYLTDEINKLGLDISELNTAWEQAGFESSKHSNRLYNLFELLRLEKEQPGAATELFHRFGIADFARYPRAVLKEQFENRDRADVPYGIMLFPRSDWNGVFYDDVDLISNLRASLGDSYQLRIVEAESKWEIARHLVDLNNTYADAENGHKIGFAVICGHGNENIIDFGGKDPRHRLQISDLASPGIARTGSFFEEHPTFVLASCTTGKEGGIAQELSRVLGATVIAPNGDTKTPQSITFTEGKGFDVSFSKGIVTRTYREGAPV